jgi:predicted Fe-Mo cluster-binding NifX family protein
MANGELFEVHVFSNDPELAPSRGAVYISSQLTREQADVLVEREQAKGRYCRVEAM